MSDGLSTETHEDCLDITEPFVYDESIQLLQYFEFTPQTFANCNTVGHQIKIYINAQDMYTLPSKSYINIKEQLCRNDNDNSYAAADEVALISNAMMCLLTEIKYDLDNTNIEKLFSPGQITSLFGHLSQPDDFSTSAGLKYCWNKDTAIHASSAEFAESALAPAAHYTPAQSAEYNAGFAARKGFTLQFKSDRTFLIQYSTQSYFRICRV